MWLPLKVMQNQIISLKSNFCVMLEPKVVRSMIVHGPDRHIYFLMISCRFHVRIKWNQEDSGFKLCFNIAMEAKGPMTKKPGKCVLWFEVVSHDLMEKSWKIKRISAEMEMERCAIIMVYSVLTDITYDLTVIYYCV